METAARICEGTAIHDLAILEDEAMMDEDQNVTPPAAKATTWQPTHRHYKGGLYRVLFEAIHTETEEPMTVYQTPDGRHWVRPAAMFNEILPDGRPRFAPITS